MVSYVKTILLTKTKYDYIFSISNIFPVQMVTQKKFSMAYCKEHCDIQVPCKLETVGTPCYRTCLQL
jgi:hypothetical protein